MEKATEPDGVIIWDLDPRKNVTSYWVRHRGTDLGRFPDWDHAMKVAQRQAVQHAADIWRRRGNDYTCVWKFKPGAIAD